MSTQNRLSRDRKRDKKSLKTIIILVLKKNESTIYFSKKFIGTFPIVDSIKILKKSIEIESHIFNTESDLLEIYAVDTQNDLSNDEYIFLNVKGWEQINSIYV